MLIAQITDLHLGFTPGNPRDMNQLRLEKTIAAICALDVTPDLVLATGDPGFLAQARLAALRFTSYAPCVVLRTPFPSGPILPATAAPPPLSSGLCSSAVFIGFRSVVFDDFGGIHVRDRSLNA